MNLEQKENMTFESMQEILNEKFPQHKVSVKKNPLAGFQFVEVRKSGTVGTWIRINDNKRQVKLINGMPSAGARAMLGGLLIIAFVYGSQNKLRKEVAKVLSDHFQTN